MTDDAQQATMDSQVPSLPATNDPLASLEDLLNKAKSRRAGSSAPDEVLPPAGPSPEEIQAKQQAQQQAELAIQEQQAEELRLQQLEVQRQKMANELQNTPEYQARQEQNQEEAEKAEEAKAAQLGHVIHQVGDAKI